MRIVLAFILLLAYFIFQNLPVQDFSQKSKAPSPSFGNDEALEKVIMMRQGEQCSTSEIFGCFKNDGGEACLTRCGLGPRFFCEEVSLNICLNAGNSSKACYKNHCDGGGEGYFDVSHIADTNENIEQNKAGLTLFSQTEYGVGYALYPSEISPKYMQYGSKRTIARIKELAKRVFRKSGYPLYIGDLSHRENKCTNRHKGHIGGKEVDIAVMGNTPKKHVGRFWNSKHDHDASRILINEAKKMGGVRKIYFNDPRFFLAEFFGFVEFHPSHEDHYHIYWDGKQKSVVCP